VSLYSITWSISRALTSYLFSTPLSSLSSSSSSLLSHHLTLLQRYAIMSLVYRWIPIGKER
jgi:hypothetical protein